MSDQYKKLADFCRNDITFLIKNFNAVFDFDHIIIINFIQTNYSQTITIQKFATIFEFILLNIFKFKNYIFCK